MHLSCCGINHHTCGLEDREQYQLSRLDIGTIAERYKQITQAQETVVITTCNRIEFYRIDQSKKDIRESIHKYFAEEKGYNRDKLDSIIFVRQGTSASRHLFRVTSGLDSVLIGEYQILNQVKDAYSSCCSKNTAGRFLHKLFHNAFQVSKKIRTETDIGKGAQGLAGASVDILTEVLEVDLTSKKVVVIGINKSVEMLLRRLSKLKADVILINRTINRAEKLAKLFGYKVIQFEKRSEVVSEADFIFSTTSAKDFILRKKDFLIQRGRKKTIAIDLAMPRDIAPEVGTIEGITLIDLEDIKNYLDNINADRSAELPEALDIVEDQVRTYDKWWRNCFNGNHSELRSIIEDDRNMILNRFQDNFKKGDFRALDAFSKSLFKQFMRRVNSMENT
ncbi:glutamyl-tRNA reductase [bacterium]|nr:glutamyl-tRNA reductase [bacterium]